jgi:cyclic pyranopterin phosphate synthase
MVDVSGKPQTERRAVARGTVRLTPSLRDRVLAGDLPKGEAMAVARLAGIQGAKETARLVPLCHPVPLTAVSVEFEVSGDDAVVIVAEVRSVGATGVEMEALTAVSVAALSLYDMCKAAHRGIVIGPIELVHKSGGRSGVWERGSGGAA